MISKGTDKRTPWRLDRTGYDPDDKARELRKRFAKSVHPSVSRRRSRGFWKALAMASVVGIVVGWLLGTSPWPMMTTIRHYVAAPNCDFARMVSLAPAFEGQPGYWSKHDADDDGIACEPYYGWR